MKAIPFIILIHKQRQTPQKIKINHIFSTLQYKLLIMNPLNVEKSISRKFLFNYLLDFDPEKKKQKKKKKRETSE